MGKVDLKMNKVGEQLKVEIIGTIDEDMDFTQFNLAGNQTIEFEMNGMN